MVRWAKHLSLVAVTAFGVRAAKSAAPDGARVERAHPGKVSKDLVFLLHGISKTHFDMVPMGRALRRAGFDTVNWKYPSRRHTIPELAAKFEEVVAAFPAERIHFVTHSMGGIVVRMYLDKNKPANAGRFVMIAPPNQGARMATFFQGNPLYNVWMGPAGRDLCFADGGLCASAGIPECEFGIIAGGLGNRVGIMPLLKADNDGTVTVDEARLEGAADFLVVPYHHAMIHYMPRTTRNVVEFLKTGRFKESARRKQPRAYREVAAN